MSRREYNFKSDISKNSFKTNRSFYKISSRARELTIKNLAAALGKSRNAFVIYLLEKCTEYDPELKLRYKTYYDENLRILEEEAKNISSKNNIRQSNNQKSDL